MRVTALLRRLMGIEKTVVKGFRIEVGALIIEVRPTWRKAHCFRCGKPRSLFNTLGSRGWRHLDFKGLRIYLEYRIRRVNCPSCGVAVEAVPWSDDQNSHFTTDFLRNRWAIWSSDATRRALKKSSGSLGGR